MAEVLVGSTSLIGIGYKLSQARFNLEIADLFAWTTIITTIIILVDYLLLNLKQKTMSLFHKKLMRGIHSFYFCKVLDNDLT